MILFKLICLVIWSMYYFIVNLQVIYQLLIRSQSSCRVVN
jgi:hypothetical protein